MLSKPYFGNRGYLDRIIGSIPQIYNGKESAFKYTVLCILNSVMS